MKSLLPYIPRAALMLLSVVQLKHQCILGLKSPPSTTTSSNNLNQNRIINTRGSHKAPIISHTSLLKYSNLPEEERKYNTGNNKLIDDWFGKWFEENFHKSVEQLKTQISRNNDIHMPYFTPDFTSVDGLGGGIKFHKVDITSGKSDKKNEIDQDMQGSNIRHFPELEDAMDGIEILPSADSMIDLNTLNHQVQNNNLSTKGDSKTKPIIDRLRHRYKHISQQRKEHKMPLYGTSQHVERMNLDIRHLSLNIAGNIDNQEQWKEFFEDSQCEGLKSILQCVRDCAEEIKRGYATDIFDDNNDVSMLDRETRRENAFVAACTSVKVLRDLCSIDQNWASVITDEILSIDQNWRKFGKSGFLEDLALVLKYTNEVEMFYTRKIGRKRRELRAHGITIKRFGSRKQRREARRRCTLYINQMLLGMAIASDHAINAFRSTPGLLDSIILSSSYNAQDKLKGRWYRYPIEKLKIVKDTVLRIKTKYSKRPFLEAAKIRGGLIGNIQATSNKLLAALGHNIFVPKTPGQRGLRILSLDGGGTRGIASIAMIKAIVDEMGVEVCDLFDIICGTSTGAIIAFLVGLRLESSEKARNRYDELIEKIFVKHSLSAPMLFLTTAAYSDVPFKKVTGEILGDYSMLDSRADPRVPYVFAVSSKMSSSTSKLSLFRNYNYRGNEKPDKFIVSPEEARRKLGFKQKDYFDYNASTLKNYNEEESQVEGSRHDGSFRVLQRAALRATTAAPTVFKPVVMGGEIYSDGGIVASNPAAVAIHEARTLFPDIPIELFVSVGTGEFVSETQNPAFGWDGIVHQIVKSATDTAKTHWVLEDILGQGNTCNGSLGASNTKYFRFDPVIGTPTDFPIDGTDAKRLQLLSDMTSKYMREETQSKKLKEIKIILSGRKNNMFSRIFKRA